MPRASRKTSNPFGVGRGVGTRLLSRRRGGVAGLVGCGVVLLIASQLGPHDWSGVGLAMSLLVIVGGAVLWFKHAARIRIGRELIARQQSLATISLLTWEEFEQFVGELYRGRGYEVTERLQGGADGGIDLELERDGTKTLVQCKHWKTTSVGAPIVREMLGLMTRHQAQFGKIVCTGKFTRDAHAFAEGQPLDLVDGTALWHLVRSAQEGNRSTGK